MRIKTFLIMVLSLASLTAFAQGGGVKGKVVSRTTRAAIDGVKVTLTPGDITTTTDATGNFEIDKLAKGEYSLTFESTEIEYKHFKSVLEGGVEVQPKNVLVYVTSNRRNLVKETWTDRNSQDGEIFAQDGIQERQSLADRFGLTITFYAPDKELYTEIVRSLAEREGLDPDSQQLIEEANKWDMRQTSRSGRSAKQFVTHISGIYSERKE